MTSTLNSCFDATSFTPSRPVFAVPDTNIKRLSVCDKDESLM